MPRHQGPHSRSADQQRQNITLPTFINKRCERLAKKTLTDVRLPVPAGPHLTIRVRAGPRPRTEFSAALPSVAAWLHWRPRWAGPLGTPAAAAAAATQGRAGAGPSRDRLPSDRRTRTCRGPQAWATVPIPSRISWINRVPGRGPELNRDIKSLAPELPVDSERFVLARQIGSPGKCLKDWLASDSELQAWLWPWLSQTKNNLNWAIPSTPWPRAQTRHELASRRRTTTTWNCKDCWAWGTVLGAVRVTRMT